MMSNVKKALVVLALAATASTSASAFIPSSASVKNVATINNGARRMPLASNK